MCVCSPSCQKNSRDDVVDALVMTWLGYYFAEHGHIIEWRLRSSMWTSIVSTFRWSCCVILKSTRTGQPQLRRRYGCTLALLAVHLISPFNCIVALASDHHPC